MAAANQGWADQVAQWGKDFKADKQFGGTKFKQSIRDARLAVSKLGRPGFLERLEKSGFGSNPDFLAFAASVGARMRGGVKKVVKGAAVPSDSGPTWNTLFKKSGNLEE